MQGLRISRRAFVQWCAMGIAMASLSQGCAPTLPAAAPVPRRRRLLARRNETAIWFTRVAAQIQNTNPVSDGTLNDRFPQGRVQFAGKSRFQSSADS